jgi:pteridine reductase
MQGKFAAGAPHAEKFLWALCYLCAMADAGKDHEKKLLGRVALITGAGKRLGRAVALRLAAEGSDVAVHYGKSKAEALEVVAEIQRLGRRAIALQANLTKVTEIQTTIESVKKEFGRLDILVNNAANFIETKFSEITEESWDQSLDANLKGSFFMAQAATPLLAQSGTGVIINFSDIGGLMGWPAFLPHSIAKAGVITMTRILAKALAPGIRVNAIAPGTITMSGDPEEWEKDFIRRAPLRRSGTPQDITDAVMYLVSAEFVTGQVLVVDGGRTL